MQGRERQLSLYCWFVIAKYQVRLKFISTQKKPPSVFPLFDSPFYPLGIGQKERRIDNMNLEAETSVDNVFLDLLFPTYIILRRLYLHFYICDGIW